jgi:hypothetical protein
MRVADSPLVVLVAVIRRPGVGQEVVATLVPSGSQILSTAEDVGMLNQAIEVLVLLSE